MFLFAEGFNEGGSVLSIPKTKFNELREGLNPKNNLFPQQSINQWISKKRDSLVNRRWEKLRNAF
ncbi:MAG: hypothetical protein HQ541_15080 [Mariniphaga sp.]|nr:hypothetical protein [Mariniphaga sp.]